MSEPKQTSHHPTQTFTDGTPIAAPFGGTYAVNPEPANPEGLTKPTQAEREALKSGRLPDLMHLLAKVAKVERSLTRGYNVRMQDNASAAALRRLVNQAVRDCAAAIVAALAMHPGRSQQ